MAWGEFARLQIRGGKVDVIDGPTPALVAEGMMVEGQRQEIATLRSRGASPGQIAGLYLVEGLVLAGVALALGLPLGALLARAMGAVAGFLQFVRRTQPPLLLSGAFWGYGLAAAGLAALAYRLPALPAARQSIVAQKQEAARRLTRPLWSRLGLDFLLLGLAG
ncbi:MAG: FtsX-like permease family protein [Firmicutes bacterium]|nr:FtsX-like permease family protein [Bacillota bacterium]